MSYAAPALQRSPLSHKGENGRVAIIGGSPTMHGAPLFSALAAQASGVDLIFVRVPKSQADVARLTSLNFQVWPFSGDQLSRKDIASTYELLQSVDCAVIGPGMDSSGDSLKAIIKQAPCTLVLDAAALRTDTLDLVRHKPAVLTPHRGELERMGLKEADLSLKAQQYDVTFFLKGPTDLIVDSHGKTHTITGGNAGLTVGGTGDALAGLIAGLIAQKMKPIDACMMAGRILKRAGSLLFPTHGYAYTTQSVIEQIPHLLLTLPHS